MRKLVHEKSADEEIVLFNEVQSQIVELRFTNSRQGYDPSNRYMLLKTNIGWMDRHSDTFS